MSVVVALATALVSVGVLVHAIRRTRREPRRLSNGFWLLAGALLTLELAAGIGIPGAGAVEGLLVLLVGRGSDERLPEAEAMAAWAVEHGADPAYVMVEDRSRNTEENLQHTPSAPLTSHLHFASMPA